jgi:hypothetical protein
MPRPISGIWVRRVLTEKRLSAKAMLPDGQDHVDRFGKNFVAVFVQDAQGFRIRGQRSR